MTQPLDPLADAFLRVLTSMVRLGHAFPLSYLSLCKAYRSDAQLWDAAVHNTPPHSAHTHLMHAARAGDLARVRFLLARGAPVDAHPTPECQDQPLFTALYKTSANGHAAIVAELLEHAADPCNGLHIAAAMGATPILRLLVQRGCDVNLCRRLCPSQCPNSPLCHAAAAAGHCEPGKDGKPLAVMECVLELGADMKNAISCASAGSRSAGGLKLLLSAGADAAAVLPFGCTPIHSAARCGSEECVLALLEAAPSQALSRDTEGGTALLFAASRGQVRVVRALLDAGADVNARRAPCGVAPQEPGEEEGDGEAAGEVEGGAGGGGGAAGGGGAPAAPAQGDSALHLAAFCGHESIVSMLCHAGADVGAVSQPSGHTPLLAALQERSLHSMGGADSPVAVRLCAALIDAGSDVNAARMTDGCTPLMFSSQFGHLDVVRLLLDRGVNVSAQRVGSGLTALFFAASHGRGEVVAALLAAGASPHVATPSGYTALMASAEQGHGGTVRALLAAGADVHARCVERADAPQPEGAAAGLGGGAGGEPPAAPGPPGTQGDTALHFAAYFGHADAIRALHAGGAEVEAVSRPSGRTPLHAAMLQWRAPAVFALLALGADASAVTAGGLTTVMQAAMPQGVAGDGEPVAVRLCAALCAAGADVNAQRLRGAQPDGCTALMFASEWGRLSLVRVLLAAGAGVHARRVDNGLTALFFAAQRARVGTVAALLQAGASPDVDTPEGSSALMAAASGHAAESAGAATEVVRLLLRAGAKAGARDCMGRSALAHAMGGRNWATVALLGPGGGAQPVRVPAE